MRKLIASPAGRLTVLLTVLAMCLLGAQASTAAGSVDRTAARPVAHTRAGDLTSRIVGTTANGRDVTGKFVPLHFVKRNGHIRVRGLVMGVVHERNGTRTTFATLRSMTVKSINGTPARTGRVASAQAVCDILHLVLRPIDLNLLGLRVHLSRVVLNIDAVSGPGNLLGNLLCAVAGLLDGGLQGLLGRLTNLLNQILGTLRLG